MTQEPIAQKRSFLGTNWGNRVDVSGFIYENLTPCSGNASFLEGPTKRAQAVWNKTREYLKEERDNNGLRSAGVQAISGIASHAPGANRMHGRDCRGAIGSLNLVAKPNYEVAQDGISNTFCIIPKALGATKEERTGNLTGSAGGHFTKKARHPNVNVLNRDTLADAYGHPGNYPQLTISGTGLCSKFCTAFKSPPAKSN